MKKKLPGDGWSWSKRKPVRESAMRMNNSKVLISANFTGLRHHLNTKRAPVRGVHAYKD